MAYTIGELIWRIEADTSDFDSNVNNSADTAESMGDKLTTVGKAAIAGFTALIVAGAAEMSKELINAASDAEETANKFNVVFESMADEADAAANALSDGFGLSSTAAKTLLGDTGDLLTGFGLTTESALDLSIQTNQLAVDLASFTNAQGGAEAVSAALTSAYTGERDSLKSYGIVISEAMVQAQLLEDAQNGLTFASEAEAESYATLTLALEQSTNAIGDFERSSDSYANQVRVAEAAVDDFKVALGQNLLPTATELVSTFAGLTEKVTEFIEERNRLKELANFDEENASLDEQVGYYEDINAELYKQIEA